MLYLMTASRGHKANTLNTLISILRKNVLLLNQLFWWPHQMKTEKKYQNFQNLNKQTKKFEFVPIQSFCFSFTRQKSINLCTMFFLNKRDYVHIFYSVLRQNECQCLPLSNCYFLLCIFDSMRSEVAHSNQSELLFTAPTVATAVDNII